MAIKDRYWTISEAAKQFNVTRQTISRWIADGKISVEKVGRETLIKKKDLHQYHRRRLSEAAAESIVDLYLATAEDYCREKGWFKGAGHFEIGQIDEDDKAKGDIQLSPEQMDEMLSHFRPILEGFLKDFAKDVRKKENLPKDKQQIIKRNIIRKPRNKGKTVKE